MQSPLQSNVKKVSIVFSLLWKVRYRNFKIPLKWFRQNHFSCICSLSPFFFQIDLQWYIVNWSIFPRTSFILCQSTFYLGNDKDLDQCSIGGNHFDQISFKLLNSSILIQAYQKRLHYPICKLIFTHYSLNYFPQCSSRCLFLWSINQLSISKLSSTCLMLTPMKQFLTSCLMLNQRRYFIYIYTFGCSFLGEANW